MISYKTLSRRYFFAGSIGLVKKGDVIKAGIQGLGEIEVGII